jgi:hypothetical protein
LNFFRAAFSKASTIDLSYAEHATNTLGWIGLTFYEAGNLKITETGVDNIISAASQCFKKAGASSYYQLAGLLMSILYIKILAEAKRDDTTVRVLDSKLMNLEEMIGEQWPKMLQALQMRQRPLQEELNSYDQNVLIMFDKTKRLLKQLIEKYQSGNGESGSPPMMRANRDSIGGNQTFQ